MPKFPVYSNQPPPSPWIYDDAFGIVHQHGCRVCRGYTRHILDESDVDYAFTVSEREEVRERELQNRFLDGVRQGRDTQRQRDKDLLNEYRSQRDSARNAQLFSGKALWEAREEVIQLRDELKAVYDEFRSHSPPEHPNPSGCKALPSSGENFELNEPSFGSAPSWHVKGTADCENSEQVHRARLSPHMRSGHRMGSSGDLVVSSAGILDKPSSKMTLVRPDELPHLSLFGTKFDIGGPAGPSGSVNMRPPLRPGVPYRVSEDEILEEMGRTLRFTGFPENQHVVLRVNELASGAHETPVLERTEVQNLLLREWKAPPITIPPTRCLLAPNYSSEVYVDACQVGIGFVFKDQWQAWRFKKNWKAEGREIQWAEAVAVELGLRMMIEAGCYGKILRIRSDNTGVVEAISKQDIYHYQVGDIVTHIDRLCQIYKITLEIEWIAGAENPADAPSRLLPEEGSQRFPWTISVPEHLQEFISLYIEEP